MTCSAAEVALEAEAVLGIHAAQEKFHEAALRSADLRSRILFSRRGTFDQHDRHADDPIPLARLLEESADSRDPLVLGLLLDRCRIDAMPGCDPVGLARRWVDADPQGVVPWVELASVLEAAGDGAAAAESWLRASRAPELHDHFLPRLRAALATVPIDADPVARRWDLVYIGLFIQTVQTPWGNDLERACRSPMLRDVCEAIAATMVRDGDRIGILQFASRLSRLAGAPEATIADRDRTAFAVFYGMNEARRVFVAELEEVASADRMRRANEREEFEIARGPVAIGREQLARMGLTEEEAVGRWEGQGRTRAPSAPSK